MPHVSFLQRQLCTSALVLLSYVGLLDVVATATAAPITNAPIMPLAEQSLLLDISRAGERLVVAGERGHILYSDDDGRSWTQSQVPTRKMLTALFFVDEHNGWAVGHDGLVLATDDGAVTWRIQRDGLAVQQQLNIEQRELALRRLASQEKQADASDAVAAEQLEEAELDLEDANLALSEPVFTSPLMDIWFQNANEGWAVGAFGTLLATDNGGERWQTLSTVLDNPEEFHLNSVVGDDDGKLFIAGEGGLMYRSTDSGRNWHKLPPVYDGSWFAALYCRVTDTLLTMGLRGNLYRSNDFGDSWQQVLLNIEQTLAGGNACPDSQSTVSIAGAGGTVLLSDDGGSTFTLHRGDKGSNLGSAIANDSRVIAVGQGGIYRRLKGDEYAR
tara:strand:- start:32110 stop:33270 length:1161 start_codon:yes stop_codon:yes gene_type:complete